MSSPAAPIPAPQVDPLHFELRGSRLIEASAGTGKTWTLAALYVRLVLGHGGQPARLPGEILVLTFTEAATRELRDRIRARLSDAASCFADPAWEGDAFLAALRADYPQEGWLGCARLLQLAAESMDEAAIFTIHGWCQRVLREHAFDSGSLFEFVIQPDLSEQRRQVAWDYWRAEVAGLSSSVLESVLSVWSGPDRLLPLTSLLTRDGVPAAPSKDLTQIGAEVRAERVAALAALKEPWVQGAETLGRWLESQRGGLKPYRATDVQRWLGELRAWALDPEREEPDLKTGWKRLVPEGMAAWWHGDGAVPRHPLSEALAALRRDLDALPGPCGPFTQHALGWMAVRLRQLMAATALTGYDGLLTGLVSALEGERGPVLTQTLRTQFPAALIDEFQDTDPVQYRIFDRIYGVARNDPRCALVLIGDPKQAIYGFRGADVHTYLRAARDCAGRVETLSRNFRSSTQMVRAVNQVFEASGSTAFPTGAEGEAIAFHPAQAQGQSLVWNVRDEPAAALAAHWLAAEVPGKPWPVDRYRRRAAQACAARVAHVLALGRQGKAGWEGGAQWRAVGPADVAVLVGTHKEAALVRTALSQFGVRSVYLSERVSVYDTPLAQELGICLQACAHPEDERAVRAALATPLLGRSLGALHDLAEDEEAWDAQVERFQEYHRWWLERGVLPALRRLLHDFSVPARLLALGHEGERQLTDALHLAELLQQASLRLDGMQAVLAFLQQQRLSSADDEARHLRLESDDDLVKVVTIHKSKGLEYPLVFLPFLCVGGAPGGGPARLVQAGDAEWVLDPDPGQRAWLAREQLGEEVRKLYVALTRACHAVWLALGDVKGIGQTGMGHVLGGDPRSAWDDLVRAGEGAIAWLEMDPRGGDEAIAAPVPAPLGPARRLVAPVVTHPWWIASYSALHRLGELAAGGGAGAAPQSAAEDVLRESRAPAVALPPDPAGGPAPDTPLPGFPRGSEAGTFLHGLLEWAARRNFRDLDEARDVIARRCQVRGWEAHIETLHRWLLEFVAEEWRPDLPGGPMLRLDALQQGLPEMEFWLPVSSVDVVRLDALITSGLFPNHPRPALAPDRLNGMFKGYIDLVFQSEGRYYLADYKSNDLGAHAGAYDAAALVAEMCAARYDVQLMMYVLALHRQLRARLPDYDYERDVGGALYLFLRGQGAPGQGVLALRPPRRLIEDLDALFAGREPAHA